VNQLSAQKFTQDELIDRLNAINERLNSLRVESDEVGSFDKGGRCDEVGVVVHS